MNEGIHFSYALNISDTHSFLYVPKNHDTHYSSFQTQFHDIPPKVPSVASRTATVPETSPSTHVVLRGGRSGPSETRRGARARAVAGAEPGPVPAAAVAGVAAGGAARRRRGAEARAAAAQTAAAVEAATRRGAAAPRAVCAHTAGQRAARVATPAARRRCVGAVSTRRPRLRAS